MKASAVCTCDAGKVPKKLRKGKEQDIYIERTDGSIYKEGRGVLLRKVKEIGEPFPYNTGCKIHGTEDGMFNVIKEMWVIHRVDDKFLKDQEFVRNFIRFHSIGLLTSTSRYDDPPVDLLTDFCFSELDGDQRLCEDLKEEIQGKRSKTNLYRNYSKFLKMYKNN